MKMGLKPFAIITSIASYLMLLMGAIVTKTGSGEGCGNSWPFCHGQLIPASLPIETVIEYGHRIVSGGVGLLILLLTIGSWIVYRGNRKVQFLSFCSLFFVILQGGLGALTVVFKGAFAKKTALALHFGFSLISFASVVLLTVVLMQLKNENPTPKIQVSRPMKLSIWGMTIYTYLVVYTGALVRHAGATMGCGYSFPACGSQLFPDVSSQAGIQMLHRYAAILLWLLVLIFLWNVVKHYRYHTTFVRSSWLAFILITLQALSGILTIQLDGQLVIALIHTTIISIFFSVFCYLCMQTESNRKTVDNQKEVRYT